MAEKAHAEVNWQSYFANIRETCPWSYSAYMNDRILIVDYNSKDFSTWKIFLPYTKFESVVYVCRDKTSDWLNTTCDALNVEDADSEWLWSHPEHEGDSTPVPVLIQQPRKKLEELRKKVGYYEHDG